MQYTNDLTVLLRTATPATGVLKFEVSSQLNANELNATNWLIQSIGGNITALAENNPDGQENPDLFWRGGKIDIKHITGGLNALSKRVQHAMKQTNKNGALVDISATLFSNEAAIKVAINRLRVSGGNYVILIRDNQLVGYISK